MRMPLLDLAIAPKRNYLWRMWNMRKTSIILCTYLASAEPLWLKSFSMLIYANAPSMRTMCTSCWYRQTMWAYWVWCVCANVSWDKCLMQKTVSALWGLPGKLSTGEELRHKDRKNRKKSKLIPY